MGLVQGLGAFRRMGRARGFAAYRASGVCGRHILCAVAKGVGSGFALPVKSLSGTKLAVCGAAREFNPKVKYMSLTDDKLRQTITSTADLAGASLVTRIVVNRLRMQVQANPAKIADKVLELKDFLAKNPDAARVSSRV